MPRIEMEHIAYELNVPPQGADGDKMFFVQIDPEKCIGCDSCQEYCPSGAIYGETGLTHKIAHPEPCINCAQCLTHCPEMAIYEVQTWVPELQKKLQDKSVKCIAMPAPSSTPKKQKKPLRFPARRWAQLAACVAVCGVCLYGAVHAYEWKGVTLLGGGSSSNYSAAKASAPQAAVYSMEDTENAASGSADNGVSTFGAEQF